MSSNKASNLKVFKKKAIRDNEKKKNVYYGSNWSTSSNLRGKLDISESEDDTVFSVKMIIYDKLRGKKVSKIKQYLREQDSISSSSDVSILSELSDITLTPQKRTKLVIRKRNNPPSTIICKSIKKRHARSNVVSQILENLDTISSPSGCTNPKK